MAEFTIRHDVYIHDVRQDETGQKLDRLTTAIETLVQKFAESEETQNQIDQMAADLDSSGNDLANDVAAAQHSTQE